MLETLGSDQPLDLGGLGVRLLALTLGLDLTSDDVLADLFEISHINICVSVSQTLLGGIRCRDSSLSSRSSNDRAGDDECSTYIVILAEAEEAADLGGTLGAEALGVDDVGQAGNVGLTLLDNGESEDGEIHADDAATNRLAFALTGAAGSVAGVAVGEEEADTGRVHDTLLHRETLLVVATGDAEDVALELVAKVVTGNLLAHLQKEQNRTR